VTGTTPDTSQDRKKRTNVGGGINVEQPVSDDLGFFLRASTSTDVTRPSISPRSALDFRGGLVLTGANWDGEGRDRGRGRRQRAFGSEVKYFAAGGLGKLIGDAASTITASTFWRPITNTISARACTSPATINSSRTPPTTRIGPGEHLRAAPACGILIQKPCRGQSLNGELGPVDRTSQVIWTKALLGVRHG